MMCIGDNTTNTAADGQVAQTEMLLKILNPVSAVVMRAPGICGCQCTSFTSLWPWCTNSNCGGTSRSPPCGDCAGCSSSSSSTDRSQSDTWSSRPEAAKMLSSVGCHSIDETGAECQRKEATGDGAADAPLCDGRNTICVSSFI